MEQETQGDFMPGTPPEVQEALVKVRGMMEDPEMDEGIAIALNSKDLVKGIAMFLDALIVQAQSQLQLGPDEIFAENGLAANLIVDMIADAVELGLIEASDTDTQTKIVIETMTTLEKAMMEGMGPEEGMEEGMDQGMPPPQMGKPPAGIPAGLGAPR
jgi:hypothetical protein